MEYLFTQYWIVLKSAVRAFRESRNSIMKMRGTDAWCPIEAKRLAKIMARCMKLNIMTPIAMDARNLSLAFKIVCLIHCFYVECGSWRLAKAIVSSIKFITRIVEQNQERPFHPSFMAPTFSHIGTLVRIWFLMKLWRMCHWMTVTCLLVVQCVSRASSSCAVVPFFNLSANSLTIHFG